MSDNIPFDIQKKIMKKFPVKSLIQFRSVSKLWKSVIDSSEFISNYHVNNPQLQHHQLIYADFKEKYVSVLDDETFPQHKSFLDVPMSVNQLHPFGIPKVMGCSQGLFCFYNHNRYPREDSGTAVIWNPSIRKSVVINVPHVLLHRPYETDVGFAVCPHTNDPKLVKIISNPIEHRHIDGGEPWHIEVYTLSSGVWRTLSINLPTERITLAGDQEVLDGFIYFLSIDRPYVGRMVDRPFVGNVLCLYESNYVITSFDTINEEFTKISLPDCLLPVNPNIDLIMSKLRGSLVVIAYDTECGGNVTDVWMMDHGVTKSFNNVFCIDPPDGCIQRVLGFRKSGEAIIIMKNDNDDSDDNDDDNSDGEAIIILKNDHDDSDDDDDDADDNSDGDDDDDKPDDDAIVILKSDLDDSENYLSLFVYDPYSEHMDNIGISGKAYPLSAKCYTETLLLLDH